MSRQNRRQFFQEHRTTIISRSVNCIASVHRTKRSILRLSAMHKPSSTAFSIVQTTGCWRISFSLVDACAPWWAQLMEWTCTCTGTYVIALTTWTTAAGAINQLLCLQSISISLCSTPVESYWFLTCHLPFYHVHVFGAMTQLDFPPPPIFLRESLGITKGACHLLSRYSLSKLS